MAKIKDRSQAHPRTDDDHCFVVGAHAFVLRVTSFFGMAPLRFKSHNNGYIVSLSIPMCIYSYIMITATVSIAFFGIIAEIQLGTSPFRHNSSQLSQVMSFCDLSFLALLGSVGVYVAPSRMKTLIKFMGTIASIDKIMTPEYCDMKERRWCAGFLLFMFFFTLMLMDDIYFSIIYAPPDKQWNLVEHYCGFYILWYLVMIFEVQFFFTAMMVHDRFKTLNEVLSRTANHLSKPNIIEGPNLLLSPADCVHRNALLYNKLCDVVGDIEDGYSFSLLIILVSTLFHLIITPYFAIAEINVNKSGNLFEFILLESMWFSLHLIRVFMAVEPCHYTTSEGSKTERLVCYMMMTSPTKGALSLQLELFSRQLMLQPVCYKPMGACTLDRPLIASMFGAVTTYLVILIQFQQYET